MSAADAAAEVMRLVREYRCDSSSEVAEETYLQINAAVKALAERAYPEATK